MIDVLREFVEQYPDQRLRIFVMDRAGGYQASVEVECAELAEALRPRETAVPVKVEESEGHDADTD